MSDLENKVFDELTQLGNDYSEALAGVESVQQKIQECIDQLDWRTDTELILRLVTALPACYPRFQLMEQLHSLQSPDGIAPHGFPDVGDSLKL